MPVVVVQPDADHGDLGTHRGEEGRLGVCGAVVRHLQHVGVQVDAAADQRLLRLDLRVPRQEDALAVDRGPQHDGGVVRVGAGAVVSCRRPQHFDAHLPDVERLPHGHRLDSQAVRPQRIAHRLPSRGRLHQRACDHPPDRTVVEHAGDTTDVIEVVMREHQ
jgi:hypothetical protein